MGHSEHLQQWSIRRDHRQSNQEIQYTTAQAGNLHEMLRYSPRGQQSRGPSPSRHRQDSRLRQSARYISLLEPLLWPNPHHSNVHTGLSRQAIFAAVNASLARLDTLYIDLLQIHRFDKTVPIEETMKALHDLVESGKVHYIGASSMWAYQFATMQFCAEKNGWTKFVSMQNVYNLLYREEEREMNKFVSVPFGLFTRCLPHFELWTILWASCF